jgi:IS5 family transposase
MKQISLAQSTSGFELSAKRTRKREFLEEMNTVVPWADLVALVAPHAPVANTGRPPFAIATMLRIHFMQQWFGLSDPAMEEALHDVPLFREFAALDAGATRLPDESTILRFRHLLEEHQLAQQFLQTLIAAPSSTKNSTGKRDSEMHQTKKGNQWHFGMKAHIGVDVDSGLVHTVVGTAANVHDVTQAHKLLHGQETDAFTDSGYQGVDKRDETQELDVAWHVAMRPGKRKALDKTSQLGSLLDKLETIKARIRAKVEHPFRVIKQQFGHTKTRYKGLMKNTQQLNTLSALSNLWMVRKRILQGAGG